MNEPIVVDSAPVGDGKTADQLLQDIEQAQRQLKEPAPAKAENLEPIEPQKGDQVVSEPSDKPVETEVTSETSEEITTPGGSDKVDDTDEWMKKKGFKSKEDMARSLRNLERELHRRGKAVPEPEAYQPPAQPVYQPAPPEYRPTGSTVALQQIADHYQMAPEDVQRVAPLAQDIADYMMRQRLQPLVEDFTRLKRDYQKEAEFKRLENDPLFQNREVLREMHSLAEESPSILERPDYPKFLFDESLKRIAIRRLADSTDSTTGTPGNIRLDMPQGPPPSGKGSAGGPKSIPIKPPSSNLSIDKFARLSSAEMEQMLKKKGAWKSEPY